MRLNERGEKEVVDVSELDEQATRDELSPSSHLDCGNVDCTYYYCSDCPDGCYPECGGCICAE